MTAPLLVQQALRGGFYTLDSLTAEYALKAKRHPRYPNLVHLAYNQIDSPMGDPLVQQCRGLILDEAREWAVVARPFDKFFNYGEGHAAPIDWANVRVQEKLDGSLCYIYHYDGRWHVATSGTPDAGGEVQGFGFTFAELFWRIWRERGYTTPLVTGQTWCFELCSQYNQIVVRHEEPRLFLLGARDNRSGREIDPRLCREGFHLPPVVGHHQTVGGLDTLLQSFETFSGHQSEGYVVVDQDFRRIKVKHPGYVTLHHMRDHLTPKGILELVRMEQADDIPSYFPEWRSMFEDIADKYHHLGARIAATYATGHNVTDQKAFALEVKHLPYSGVLFALRSGKVRSVQEALRAMRIETLMDLVLAGTVHAL